MADAVAARGTDMRRFGHLRGPREEFARRCRFRSSPFVVGL